MCRDIRDPSFWLNVMLYRRKEWSTATRLFDLDARWWLVVSFTFGIKTVAFDYITCYIDTAVTGCC